jgi:LCP family protein required for cell wall assembly
VTPRTASDRVNILLTGLDSGHDRRHSLSDTLLVVSIDPSERTVVMVSFPRDISNFPMYHSGTYEGKINSLWTTVRNNPGRYPDGPISTLGKQIGFLLGVPIHYVAAINLEGFERMVNLVGGVDVVNPKRIADSTYDWFDGTYGFYLPAGKQHLDGRTALAFVRSRKGAGDNDFTRAARQQLLLVAVRNRMTDPSILAKLPAILDAAARTIQTNFPPDRLREFLELSKAIDDQTIQRVVLGPPYAWHPPTSSTGGIYTLQLHMDLLAEVSVQLFGIDSAYYDEVMATPAPTSTPRPGIQ